MPISDVEFATLITLLEDGDLDDRMVALISAIEERNERRRHEILKLVESVWGAGAKVVGGGVPRIQSIPDAPAPGQSSAPAPKGYYRGQDGHFYPLDVPDLPESAPDVMTADTKVRPWPTPIESQGVAGAAPVSPVSDPMTSGSGPDPLGDNDPNIVSTGGQIGSMQ